MQKFSRDLMHLALLGFNVGFVVLSFHWISDKKWAATVAGLSFILTSGFLFLRTCRQGARGFQWTPWVSGAFLMLVAIPMVSVRVWNWSVDFSELTIWGLPGPDFHRLSSKAFLLQVVALLVDLAVRTYRSHSLSKSATSGETPTRGS